MAEAAPQRGQNAKSGSQAKPQAGHGPACRRPQHWQKEDIGSTSLPQPAQVLVIRVPSSELRVAMLLQFGRARHGQDPRPAVKLPGLAQAAARDNCEL